MKNLPQTSQRDPWIVWLVGPPASGKSTFGKRLAKLNCTVIDPDAPLPTRLRAAGLSADMRRLSREEVRTFRELRTAASDEAWSRVPEDVARGRNLVLETTGDRPSLFRRHAKHFASAGYRQLFVLLHARLATMLNRNAKRKRVVEERAVRAAWRAFRRHCKQRRYANFGAGPVIEVDADKPRAVAAAAKRVRAWVRGPGRAG